MRALLQRLVSVLPCIGVALLVACGGTVDGNQQISEAKTSALKYGHTAAIYLAGAFLDSSMTVESDAACQNPAFASQSTPSLAVVNCTVMATGQHNYTINSRTGRALYRGTLNVPQPQVTMSTSMGDIVMELNPAAAPITVNNFLAYVNAGFYANTLLHRVIAGFVVQGGGFTSGMQLQTTGLNAPIKLETNVGLSNTRATVAMARSSDPNSATAQFYVNLVDNLFLDYQDASNPGYTVFGTVVSGMDVVDAIAAVPTGAVNGYTDVPLTNVTITSATQTH